MSRTLQQLIADTRIYISQTDSTNSDFTDSELTNFLNKGQEYMATLVEYPRDTAYIQAEDGASLYTLPTDMLKLRSNIYFGDRDIKGDVAPLIPTTEEKLKMIAPGWMDNSSDSKGRPLYVILKDRRSLLIYPRPNSTYSASGYKLYVDYVYYPALMASSGDTPDLPPAYHSLLPEYAQYLCYATKLHRLDDSQKVLKIFADKAKAIKPPIDDEMDEKHFGWGNFEDGVDGVLTNGTLRIS